MAILNKHAAEAAVKGKKPRVFYGYVIAAAAFINLMVIMGTYQAFGVFFKPVLADLGWTRAMTSGAVSLSLITFGLLGIFVGRLTDRVGPRLVLSLCGFLFGLGYLLMSQIQAIWQLYLFYGVIVGAGLSGTWVPLMSTVARWFTRRRTLATGIVQTGMAVGGVVVPVAATQLIFTYDWRTTYLIIGSAVLVIAVVAAQFQRHNLADKSAEGSNEVPKRITPQIRSFSLIEAIHTRQFWQFLGVVFSLGFSMFVIYIHIVPHSLDIGVSPADAASILATVNGVSIAGRIGLGSAGDRIGNRKIYMLGFALMAISLFWLGSARELWQLYLFAAVFGLAIGGCAASESPLTAALFGLGSHGLIYGAIVIGGNTGAALGPFLAGHIFDITHSYDGAFVMTAAVSILGFLLSAVLRPIRTQVKS